MQTSAAYQDEFHGDRVTAQVGRWADAIAAVMAPQGQAAELTLERIGGRRGRAVYKVSCGPETAALKVFDLARPEMREAYLRERDMLVQLKGWSRTARHLAHCDKGGFVLTRFLRGTLVSDYAKRHGALSVAAPVGTWLGGLDARMPARPSFASWSDYLRSIDSGLPRAVTEDAEAALGGLPVRGMALARNDGGLSNLLLNNSGHCLGVDFERSRVKPRGWDFVLTALELAAQGPSPFDQVLARLGDGYVQAADQKTLVAEVSDVTRFLFTALTQKTISG